MQSTILFKNVYTAITGGEAFNATIVACDRKRGTGGKVMRLEGWIMCGRETSNVKSETAVAVAIEQMAALLGPDSKDPHHDQHGTVNVFNPANAGIHPKTIHWDLIREFNGKRVIN